MGGKGGGGGNYYQEPADHSGNATVEEAEKTLAAKKPLDLSGYQENINVKKAAADATAKKPAEDTSKPDTTAAISAGEAVADTATTTGDVAAKAVLTPPNFWADYGKAAAVDPNAQV
jgi:hypothetical protein